MNKNAFLELLRRRLAGLPEKELSESLDFYAELIDDRTDSGMSEEEAVTACGDPDQIVSDILSENAKPKAQEKSKPRKKKSAKDWVLLILGSPLWLPLLLTAAIVILTVYIVLWVVVLCIGAAALTFAVALPFGIAAAVLSAIKGNTGGALFFAGAALCCGALAILGFFLCRILAKGCVKIGKKLKDWINRLFNGKEKEEA